MKRKLTQRRKDAKENIAGPRLKRAFFLCGFAPLREMKTTAAAEIPAMRHLVALLFVSFLASVGFAQDKLPLRFEAVAKGSPFRLTRILGTPETRGHGVFSANGKRAVF